MNLPLRPEVEEAFAAALELRGNEQKAFLDSEYRRDPGLRAEVESMLRAWQAVGDFLEPVPCDAARLGGASTSQGSHALPATIGRYRILRLLGEGAMGVVYEAEQEQPRRTVALKVIRPGLAGAELLRRFAQESQTLGRLQHPGIAQIYEAGTADNGFGPQPYFAMESIQGESLLEYAEARHATPRQRLELIVKVCDAVHHAHQRGIIHRDLKPGNILVDASGQPKILDFGVARATDGDSRATRQTDVGHLVGTVAYMSPEQVMADPLELDTRSDVYALGVILFELLAGRLPYKVSRELHEAVRTIREEEPVPLSSVSRAYRGDVETIVAKALEKDMARRYSSAADLAADIQRHLEDQPIVARPPSAAYQIRKFARRHKTLAAGVAAVFAVLFAGIVTTAREATLARRAERAALRDRDRAAAAEQAATSERDRARNAEHAATSERNRAVAEKQRADTESATAKAINAFLQDDLLAQASASTQARPDTRPDPDLKVRTALDRAAARAGKFDNQPLVEASIRLTIGNTYQDLGLYPDAQQQLERALDLQRRAIGGEHPTTLRTMNTLAELYYSQGKATQAGALLGKVLAGRRRVLGEEHPDTLLSMNSLAVYYRGQGKYTEAESLYTKAVEVQQRVLGEEHTDTLTSMHNLAVLYRNQGKYRQAEPLLRRALAGRLRVLGNEHPSTLRTMQSLAMVFDDQGKYAEAEPLFTRAVEVQRRVLGEEHPDTVTSMNNLALLFDEEGKFSKAEPLFIGVLEGQRRVFGEEHRNRLLSMNNLGVLYRKQGRYPEAETLFTKGLEVQRRQLGEEHPETLITANNLAVLYREQGKYLQAEPLLTRTLEIRRTKLGPEHPSTLISMNNLAVLYREEGRQREAEELFTRVLEVRRRVLGPDHPATTSVLTLLGEIYLARGNYAEAETLLRETSRPSGPDVWERYAGQSMLGAALAAQAKHAEAEPQLLAGYQGLIERRATIPWGSRSAPEQAGERIVQFYRDWGNPEKAAEWQEKLQAAASSHRQ
jgi:tetratricopeptide (TPR) repeat protein